VVLIHHPVITPRKRRLRRLIDAADLRGVLADKGAELLLHGHDHQRALIWLDGPKTKIPAVGVPSASARAPHGDENSAGYNLFRIDGAAGNWRCDLIGRERDTDGSFRDAEQIKLY
jgi:3',5'-cyclic AMP phosphodiesterase CpdA